MEYSLRMGLGIGGLLLSEANRNIFYYFPFSLVFRFIKFVVQSSQCDRHSTAEAVSDFSLVGVPSVYLFILL